MMQSASASAKHPRLQIACALRFWRAKRRQETSVVDDAIRCDACPVLCYIKPGRTGACDRYGNQDGQLVRLDPHVVLDRAVSRGESVVPFLDRDREWDGNIVSGPANFVTAIGAGTTYPDYKPAPFIMSSEVEGVDMVTVVTEGIFSYCGVKLKIDTNRHIGDECKTVRAQGEAGGYVTTNEYGSQMLSLGGVRHLTGGSRHEGTVTCDILLNLCNGNAVDLEIDQGAKITVQADKPPIVDGVQEERMRVGCGSATIGMFAKQWFSKVDEVVVVDDHITGVLSEHQAGRLLGIPETGIKLKGRRSTPGRYFKVAEPGTSCGGAPVYVWPGGGITIMVDVSRMPENAFGYVPTPALVAPIEFTLKLADYGKLGGYMDHVRPLQSLVSDRHVSAKADNPWPLQDNRTVSKS